MLNDTTSLDVSSIDVSYRILNDKCRYIEILNYRNPIFRIMRVFPPRSGIPVCSTLIRNEKFRLYRSSKSDRLRIIHFSFYRHRIYRTRFSFDTTTVSTRKLSGGGGSLTCGKRPGPYMTRPCRQFVHESRNNEMMKNYLPYVHTHEDARGIYLERLSRPGLTYWRFELFFVDLTFPTQLAGELSVYPTSFFSR